MADLGTEMGRRESLLIPRKSPPRYWRIARRYGRSKQFPVDENRIHEGASAGDITFPCHEFGNSAGRTLVVLGTRVSAQMTAGR